MREDTINKASMLSVGSMLRGIYRIDSYLSSGGFGNTYVATNVEFDEVVAVKEFFIKGVTQRDANNTTVSVSNAENKNLFQEQMQKFKKEARRIRKLKNPHIVAVHDLFEENGTAYYVMDYIDGENLSERLKRLQHPLGEKEVMGYLPQILDALECVHGEELWHLDLKPANIMVDRQGNVTLIDFGASKQRSNKGGATTSTAVSFTNGFAPREQMEQNLEKFGPWTDLYALGATLYNLLANKKPPLPSDIDDDRSADKHLALPFPAGVSNKTKQLILRLLTTDRLDRPQSVEHVRNILATGQEQQGSVAEVESEEEEVTVVAVDDTATPSQVQVAEEVEEPVPSNSTGKVGNENGNKNKTSKSPWKSIIILSTLAVVIAAILLFGGGSSSEGTDSGSSHPTASGNAPVKKTVKAMSFTNPIGTFSYTGEVDDNNKPHGKGEAAFNNGNYYKGLFDKGNLVGENAIFKFKNGDTFVGTFKNNYFDMGTYTIAESGEYFRGSFKDGNPYHGTWYDKKGKKLEDV